MISKKLKYLFVFTISILLVGQTITLAKGDEKNKGKNTLQKPLEQVAHTYLNINNISTQFYNNGISDIDQSGNSGLVFPKGSGKTAVFTSGLLWGGLVQGDAIPRVGGTAYRTGLQPGVILPNGQADDPGLDKYRVYRVRLDVFPGGPEADFSSEVSDEGTSESVIRAQYELDWNEWPADLGAPFNDVDNNGSYDPTVDIPGVPDADQTIWFVANDMNSATTSNLYGAQPIGIEVQATFWAYSRTGAFGNMYFRKYKIINKGFQQNTVSDMYVSMWSDVDLGDAGDDFVGVDTVLSLQYCYNASASDKTYSPLPPPAVGFDFFQGPLVNGVAGQDINRNGIDDAVDTGIFDGKVVGPGLINLPMTAAYYFANGDLNVGDPPQGDIAGSTEFYNFFRGRYGINGQPFTDPDGNVTTFALYGDPLTGTGWLDGDDLPPGDRRQGSASGPFTLAPGDTQEVVVAEIVAGANPTSDRLAAIGTLKFFDDFAQLSYDNFFDLPPAPPRPEPVVIELPNKIILDWGEDRAKINATENFNSKGYRFQGYNVYQLPNGFASIEEAERIATFDIVDDLKVIFSKEYDETSGQILLLPKEFGTDSDIQRYLEITKDQIKGGTPLINGIKYYFAVTAYGVIENYDGNTPIDSFPTISYVENPIRILTVTPHSLNPGTVYEQTFGDTITGVVHEQGLSDGTVYPMVIDPSKLTGLTYTVSFDTLTAQVNDSTITVWNVDRSDGVRVIENATNQNADEFSPIADGIQFRVIGAPLDFKGFDITSNANGEITGAGCTYEVTPAATDSKGISADWYRDVVLSPNGGAISGCFEPGMQAAGGFYFVVAGGPTIASHEAAVGRWTRDGGNFSLLIPNNYEIRWTGDANNPAGKAWMAFTTGSLVDVPFSLWYLGANFDNPADDIRMMPWINDDDANDVFSFKLDHEASGANNDPYSDWIYFMMPNANPQPGEQDYLDLITAMTPDPVNWTGEIEVEYLARVILMNWNQNQGSGGENEWPEVGTTFRIRMTVPNKAGDDIFSFTAPTPSYSDAAAKSEVNKINVFPNPYYGINSEELNKYNRFVTFNHLPQKATIRIFNLAGVLVKKVEKDDLTQFARWDLNNESNLPAASGLYIAYIDMPDLGATKILKIAIIQEEQILDRF